MTLLQNIPLWEGFQGHLTGGLQWGKTMADKGGECFSGIEIQSDGIIGFR